MSSQEMSKPYPKGSVFKVQQDCKVCAISLKAGECFKLDCKPKTVEENGKEWTRWGECSVLKNGTLKSNGWGMTNSCLEEAVEKGWFVLWDVDKAVKKTKVKKKVPISKSRLEDLIL